MRRKEVFRSLGIALLAAASAAAPPSCAAVIAGDDCYPASLYPHENATASVCEARGCCWVGADAGGPPCVWMARVPPPAQQCADVSRASRVDCHPEPGASPANCAARGCCWSQAAESLGGVSECFFPHTDGYLGAAPVATPLGFDQDLALVAAQATLFGGDAPALRLSVAYETQTRVHFTISDPADATRWRVPPGLVVRDPPPAARAPATDYAVTTTQAPDAFAIIVTRMGSDQVLFDSSTETADGLLLNGVVFQPQYVEISTGLPTEHVYGLGEHSAPFQLPFNYSGADADGNLYTAWARDQPGIPVETPGGGQNLYGDHPFYMVHDPGSGESFGVLMLNSNAKDVLLQPGALTWRLTGGIIDVYIFTGPTPAEVISQYLELVGRPRMPPRWALGFHLCRWNYLSLNNTMSVWQAMQDAQIPQDAQWNDIDYMQSYRDFTNDVDKYPTAEFAAFVSKLQSARIGQHYVQIVDPGISSTAPAGSYAPYDTALDMNVFMRDAEGGVFRGNVWPGPVGFPDWSSANASAWWTACIAQWRKTIPVDGMWIDMNEISNFCDGECDGSEGSRAEEEARNRIAALKHRSDAYQAAEREGLFPSRDRPAFEAFVRAYYASHPAPAPPARARQRKQSASSSDAPFDFRYPPYLPGRLGGASDLYSKTVAADATHVMGREYDAHSLFGFMEGAASADAMEALRNERSLVISRSTFTGSGFHNGHWLGDNVAAWADMYYAICGTLSLNLFGVPLVGADTGFGGDFSPPEMAVRWHQLGATVFGFFRNHNSAGKPDQAPSSYADPYRSAMRAAITLRMTLIPYWYTTFAHAHEVGATVTRPLFFEWPTDAATAAIDTQVMVGPALMVSPVLEPGAVSRSIYVPANSTFYDLASGAPLPAASAGTTISVPAPLDVVPVHVRGGFVVPTQAPAMTTVLQAGLPISLTLALDPATLAARGWLWLDDGKSLNTHESGAYLAVDYNATHSASGASGELLGAARVRGSSPTAVLASVRVLGVSLWPTGSAATVNGAPAAATYDVVNQALTIDAGGAALDAPLRVAWGPAGAGVGVGAGMAAASAAAPGSLFDVRSFGAVGDGTHDDTGAVRAALAAAAAAGPSTVLFPAGFTFLTGAFNLSSDLVLEVQGTVKAWPTSEDNHFWLESEVPWFGPSDMLVWASFIHSANASNLTLRGGGVVDGNGDAWWACGCVGNPPPPAPPTNASAPCNGYTRPKLVHLLYGSGLTIRDLTFKSSPMWNLRPSHFDNVYITNVTVLAPISSPNVRGCNTQVRKQCLVTPTHPLFKKSYPSHNLLGLWAPLSDPPQRWHRPGRRAERTNRRLVHFGG